MYSLLWNITLLMFHQSIPAVPTPYPRLTWGSQGGYLEFYFSPRGVHCPWKAEKRDKCIVVAVTSIVISVCLRDILFAISRLILIYQISP